MTFRLHLVQSATPGVYRIGYWEDRPDRTEADRIYELNGATAQPPTKIYQPYLPFHAGTATYGSKTAAIAARRRVRRSLEALGATFQGGTVFTLPNPSALSNFISTNPL